MKALNFTVKHEQIIKDCITKSPYNLQNAFRMASNKIELFSPKQIELYWYRYLRYDEVLITVSTKEFKGYNTKNHVVETKKVQLKSIKKENINISYIIPEK